ncbi:unnamed protein product [Rhizoctonia solani]|uniref:Uncharacterized protein n=1 Tax=Rhizoctonia solani TaxID=456999 RepID=A0A8H2XL47_9AGAM|nr:unnamed protein product [Rhizoctonia solani]
MNNAAVSNSKLHKKALAFANFPTVYGPAIVRTAIFWTDQSTNKFEKVYKWRWLSPGHSIYPDSKRETRKYTNRIRILDEGAWFVANPDSSLDIILFLNSERPGLALDLSTIHTIQILLL